MRLFLVVSVALICALQLVAPDIVNSENPTLYFLFLEERKFLNAHIWESFFLSAPTNGSYNYQVYIHDNNPDRFVGPRHVNFKLLVNRTRLSTCEDTLEAMNHMLIEALGSARVPHNDDMFIYLSSDFIPVKSLVDIHQWFYRSSGDSHHRKPKSSFCISPTKEWEINSADSSHHIVKHHQWTALSRVDAALVTDRHDAEFHFNERYSLLHQFDFDNRRCLDEYWFYAALNGEVVIPKPGGNGEAAGAATAPEGLLLDSPVEQGTCHTYTFDDSYKPESPFAKGIRLGQGNHIKNSCVYNPTLDFLRDLHQSPDFFFLRRVHSEDSNTHVRGPDEGSRERVIEALAHIGVLKISNSSSNSSSSGGGGGEAKSSKPYASHVRFRRGEGDKHGLKVLMVSIDTRPIKPVLDINDYVSMTAVLQYEYCKANGYDYINFRTNDKQLEESVREKFPEVLNKSVRIFGDKYGRANYHVGYQYFRASSWGKLPPLWFLASEYGQHYDYIWFVDSDATPNPVFSNISVGDALSHWKANSETMIYRGVKDPYQSLFLFMSNFPWRADLPCAGTFLFKPTAGAVAILQEWWDFDLPQKNFDDFMEQDALWYQIENSAEYGFLLNDSVLSLLKEPQFPSNWFGVCDLWLVHIPNYDVKRNNYFRTMLKMVDRAKPESFRQAIEHITKHSSMSINVFDIAEDMERHHAKPWRTRYPRFKQGVREDDNWHMPDWNHRPPQPPTGSLFNGFVMQQQGSRSIFLIEGGKRREFPDFDTFVKMGFDMDMILAYNNKGPVFGIPEGPPLPRLH